MPQYLHDHPNFPDLLRIVEEQTGILSGLVEKDYWIMHVLYGLTKQRFNFELKGGTSLSKGYNLIHRFSEDIDIHITPPPELGVNENPKNNSDKNINARKQFYDWLAAEITIDGIISVRRDYEYDDSEGKFRSGGIRLSYESKTAELEGVKEGILLEAGFDTITPNHKCTISSWAMGKALESISKELIDNSAVDIACYDPGYTLIEKLQTIVRKFRQEKETGIITSNYMRQYYDVSCLLANEAVQQFIGTATYAEHKAARIKGKDAEIPLAEHEAFLLTDQWMAAFKERYKKTAALYYNGQPPFEDVLAIIGNSLHRL